MKGIKSFFPKARKPHLYIEKNSHPEKEIELWSESKEISSLIKDGFISSEGDKITSSEGKIISYVCRDGFTSCA